MAMRSSQTDLNRERERAQRERARMRTEEKSIFPVFSALRRTTEKDERIEQILGPFDAITKSLTTENVGISSQPQTPLPSRSKFFDSHPKKPDTKKNGYKQISENTSSILPTTLSSKPNSSGPDTKSSQNPIESSKPHLDSKYHSPDSSKNHPHQTKPPGDVQSKTETCVHPKSKTRHSSHKSPRSSSSSSDHESNHVRSTPSPKPSPNDKPKPLGTCTKQFPPLPVNGISRPPRTQLPKLNMPVEQNDVHKDVDAILQEMTNLKQPLTAISTPQKDDHFPFPTSSTVRHIPALKNFTDKPNNCKPTDDKIEDDPLDISLICPIEPLITPPETPIKPPAPQLYTEICNDVHEDLVVSESEDEAKDEPHTLAVGPSRKDPPKGTRAPVKEPRASMSSDSSSSDSENDSNSSSDDSDSSSSSSSDDDEDEEEEDEKVPVKVERTPSKSPLQSNSITWNLKDLMLKVNGDKNTKPPSVGSDDRNDNEELIQNIVHQIISPGDSITAQKSPNSIEKSPYQQPHSHSSSHGDFHSPRSVQSTPSKSSMINGITPSKKLNSDNSDSEIDVVNTPQKKMSLLSQSDDGVAKCLKFSSPQPDRQTTPKHRNKRQSSDGSIIGSLSSDSEDEEHDNNNDMTCNLEEIIHSLGTHHVPLSPIPHDVEKIPRKTPCVRRAVSKDPLKYNDGKPSIVVRLNLNYVANFLKDRIKKSPYPEKVEITSMCENEKLKSPYLNLKKSSPMKVLKSPVQDKTANTETVEMDLDTDSEMANGHIEDFTNSVMSSSSTPPATIDKCQKYHSDKITIKRKQNEPENLYNKRRKSTPKMNSKSSETAQKEKDSHEDDHKWDRKHHHRSLSKDRLRNSSSSSQTDTEKPSEFELVEEELNAQTNSDAHPSSVETIYNREGDGEIIHEPTLRKPIRRPDDPLETNDVYLSRARELKHQADILTDRITKYLLYTESMLSFIMCGCAMEKEERRATDIYRMYSDTYKLISHICKIRPSAETTDTEKKLAVLILRIQAILCYKLYRLKRMEALKFKKIIDEHHKSLSSKPPAHAPSPRWNNRSTPSPMSLSPSPAGSVGSVGSQGSSGEFTPSKLPNGNVSNQPAMSSPGTVAVPQRIHSITQQYLTNVHYIIQCHEFWDQADSMYADYKAIKEFYEEIDDQCGSLTIHSSVPDLVFYVLTGLQKIKDNT